jgi:REP-associated tyrosine transposase
VEYRGFPSRLQHGVPPWVEEGAPFHIRLRLDPLTEQRQLTDAALAPHLIDSANLYEAGHRWHIVVFMLMPDHLHAILSFARGKSISDVVSDWKRYQTMRHGVRWQQNFFDHRLRDDERREQLEEKLNYIRRNPVAAGLCARPED